MHLQNTTKPLIAALFVAAFAAGCEDKTRAAERKIVEAQQTANEVAGDAREKARDAQKEADEKIAEVKSDFAKTREDYRHEAQLRLDKLDKKLADLDAKAKAGTAGERVELEKKATELHAQRDAYAADLKQVGEATVAGWETLKTRLQSSWERLEEAVDRAT